MKAKRRQDGTGEYTSILFAFGDLKRVGGTERRMAEVARELASRGIQVEIIVRSAEQTGTVRRLFAGSAAEVHLAPTWARYLRDLHRLTKSDTSLFTFGLKQSIVGRLMKAVRQRHLTHIMARNGLDYGWPRAYFIVDRLTQYLVDVYLTNSYSVQRHLLDYGIRPSSVKVLVSALDAKWFEGGNGERGPGPSDLASVIMVGNSRPEKNQEHALRGMQKIQEPYALDIFTDDGTALRASFDSLPKGCVVSVHEGTVLEPMHYDAADILLHPSKSESLPRAVLEASARGCYIVALDTGDTSMIVDQACSSILPANASSEEIGRELARAIANVANLRENRTLIRTGTDTSAYTAALVELLSQ